MTPAQPAVERPWSVPLAVSEVPDTGGHIDVAADVQARVRRRALEERGVKVHTGIGVRKIDPASIELSTGATVKTHTTVWAAGLQACPVVNSLGVELAHGGRIPVGPDLQVKDHPGVFAIGDIAAMTDGKTGQVLPGLGSTDLVTILGARVSVLDLVLVALAVVLTAATHLWFQRTKAGLASLAMELVWIRQFTPYLGPVVYSFASILAVYLAFNAIGSRLYRAWAAARERIAATEHVLIAAGLLSLLPLVTADPRLPLDESVLAHAIRILGIGPFCAVAGFLTPLLVDRWSGGDPDRAGMAYAVNVVGCILGPLIAGF